jgi:hypothetical protein
VVALARILHDELPIGALEQGRLMGDLGVLEIVRLQHRADGLRVGLEVGRGVGQADIDGAGQRLDMDGPERMARGIETLSHPAGEDELAGEVIGPLMIGADETGGLAGALGTEFGAAMAAAIVEAAQRAGAVADDDDGRAADRQALVTAGARELDFEADQDPGAAEDRLLVEGKDLVVVIERLRQGMAGRTRLEGGLDPAVIRHPHVSDPRSYTKIIWLPAPARRCRRYVTGYSIPRANLICSWRHRISGSGGKSATVAAIFRLAILGGTVHTVASALFIQGYKCFGMRVSARRAPPPNAKVCLVRMLRVAGCEERPDVGRHG